MRGVLLLLFVLASIVYLWLWLYSLTSISIISAKAPMTSSDGNVSLNITTTSAAPSQYYQIHIDDDSQDLNYAALGIFIFWTLILNLVLIYILDRMRESKFFLLQQMLIFNVVSFGTCVLVFLCHFTDLYTNVNEWCSRLHKFGRLSFLIFVGSAISLLLFNAFKAYNVNRMDMGRQITCFPKCLSFILAGGVCCFAFFVDIFLLDIILFGVCILAAMLFEFISWYRRNGVDLKTALFGLVLMIYLPVTAVIYEMNPLLRLPCSCFTESNFTNGSCSSFYKDSDFINGTNDLLRRNSAVAMIFSLFYPALNVALVILAAPNDGIRGIFAEMFPFPHIFHRNFDQHGLLDENQRVPNPYGSDSGENSDSDDLSDDGGRFRQKINRSDAGCSSSSDGRTDDGRNIDEIDPFQSALGQPTDNAHQSPSPYNDPSRSYVQSFVDSQIEINNQAPTKSQMDNELRSNAGRGQRRKVRDEGHGAHIEIRQPPRRDCCTIL